MTILGAKSVANTRGRDNIPRDIASAEGSARDRSGSKDPLPTSSNKNQESPHEGAHLRISPYGFRCRFDHSVRRRAGASSDHDHEDDKEGLDEKEDCEEVHRQEEDCHEQEEEGAEDSFVIFLP
jgi:hypothetical protein